MSSTASSGCQPVFASTRSGPSWTARTASSVARSAAPPTLIFRAGKRRGPPGPLRDDRRLVEPEGEVGRRGVPRHAEHRADGRAGDLPEQVAEGDVDRALRAAVVGDRPVHGGVGRVEARTGRLGLADRREQERQDGGDRLDGLAVEAVRIALADPDDAREPVVAELDDDRRDVVTGVVVRAGDPERIPQAEAEDLLADVERHLSRRPRRPREPRPGRPPARRRPTAARPPRARSRAHSGPGPKRTGSSTGRPVSAAIRAISARASSSDGIDHVLRAIATTFDGATSPATRSWRSMNGRSSAIGKDASGRWSKSCSVWPALCTRTIAWGVAPWISASVTAE